jgi:hypothetical protein
MFTSLWTRVCLSFLTGLSIITLVQCSGGNDGDSPSGTTGARSPIGSNAIAQENALPGSLEWRIQNAATNGQLAAYADQDSAAAGSDVRIAVSANPPAPFRWKVFRMGGYRGMGARMYAEGGPIAAPRQPDPSFDPTTGLVVAGWPATFTIATRHGNGKPWLTGVYVLLLTKEDGWQTHAIFILRDDTRDAEVAVQLPTATWHAYNEFGGESLYVTSHGLSGGHARKVSLDRPILNLGFGSGKFLYEEHEGVRWLEDHGYDVEYLSSYDIGGAVNRIGNHHLYISLAHEEYTTMAAMDRLEAALSTGVSLAFLTGNTMPWQIRYEENGRVIVGYKELAAEDPMRSINPRLTTTLFRDPIVNRPENQITGVMSDGSSNQQPADWVVTTNSDHWVYANTGLSNGSRIPNLVFYEWDSLVNNGATPSGLIVLASSVVPNNVRPGSRHEATIYERGSAFVFAAGTVYFNQHMRTQPAVGQMVSNLLARAGATAYQP